MGDSSFTPSSFSLAARGELGLATSDTPTFAGLISSGTAGFDASPGSDIDTDLLTVNVTGTPKFFWDESQDKFSSNKGWEFSATINPVANDGAALGTSSLQWSDLFLAEGAVINFDNGDLTLTQSGDTLTLAGGTLILPAPTATVAPLKIGTGGTLLTTPEDGAIEMDDNCFYGTVDAGNRGVLPIYHIIRADSSRALSNSASEQAIFNSPTNGRLTLEAGVYRFNMIIYVTGMSATSGNYAIDPLGAGTATCGTWLYHAVGIDSTTPTNAGTQTGSFTITQQSVASAHTAATGTAAGTDITGTFEVTSAGTIIPSLTLVTASAATLAAGSFFECWRIGSTTMASVGQWD